MKLEEGMYVRTNEGKITKIIEIDKDGFERVDKCIDFTNYNIIKASYNIIDLIEPGDYVNGRLVCKIDEEDYLYLIGFDADGNYYEESLRNIKSIVTKEQFESIEYNLEG